MPKKTIYLLLLTALLAGCSVQKRRYTRGFYVSRAAGPADMKAGGSPAPTEAAGQASCLVASMSSDPILLPEPFHAPPEDTCDYIVLMNGDEYKGIVSEVSQTEVRFRNCDHLAGPTRVVNKRDVVFIRYRDGKKEVIDHSRDMPVDPAFRSVYGQPFPPRVEGLSLTAFIMSLLSMPVLLYAAPVAGYLFLLLTLVLACVGLSKIKRFPLRFHGRGFAVTAIVLTVAAMVVASFFYLNGK